MVVGALSDFRALKAMVGHPAGQETVAEIGGVGDEALLDAVGKTYLTLWIRKGDVVVNVGADLAQFDYNKVVAADVELARLAVTRM